MVLSLLPLSSHQWDCLFSDLVYHFNRLIQVAYSGILDPDQLLQIPRHQGTPLSSPCGGCQF